MSTSKSRELTEKRSREPTEKRRKTDEGVGEGI
jgi:hypothetical protein